MLNLDDDCVGLKYSYSLWVNGVNFKNFIQSQNKTLKTWCTKIGPDEYRIILGIKKNATDNFLMTKLNFIENFIFADKNTQNVWVNGEQINPEVILLRRIGFKT